MNIQELVTTALDATKPIEARQAAYQVLDRMNINKLPIDADTKLALLWAAILDDLEPAMKRQERQARAKAQEPPAKAQTQEPPAPPRQPEVLPSVPTGKELPEVPCNAFPDIFTAYRPGTSRVHPADDQIW